jgi:hypothetical protein
MTAPVSPIRQTSPSGCRRPANRALRDRRPDSYFKHCKECVSGNYPDCNQELQTQLRKLLIIPIPQNPLMPIHLNDRGEDINHIIVSFLFVKNGLLREIRKIRP